MSKIRIKITVLFENPFWALVYEREEQGKLQVAKVLFGKEPKEGQVYEFLLKKWDYLLFSKTQPIEKKESKNKNPKRIQREIHKQLQEKTISTKAQQALQRQREEQKIQKRKVSKIKREQFEKEKFNIKSLKKKIKHKGR